MDTEKSNTELESRMLSTAMEAAQEGGEVLMTHLSRVQHYEVEHKDTFDYVTAVDRASENTIVDIIRSRFPEHMILAEEGGSMGTGSHYQWVIDPLDGTTNYIHGVRNFAVSIAVMKGDVPVIGVVHDPVRGETFTARKGGGAFLNGSPISVSRTDKLEDCLLATGFPFRSKEDIEPYLLSFRRFFDQVRDIRRMGAAAIDLAYVAAGRFDGFWELNLARWDIAAGVLLIAEAGGRISGFHRDENYWETGNIIATNGAIHNSIGVVLDAIFAEPVQV